MIHSIENLSEFPFVKELIEIGEINLFGAWFDISTGQLMTHDTKSDKWTLI